MKKYRLVSFMIMTIVIGVFMNSCVHCEEKPKPPKEDSHGAQHFDTVAMIHSISKDEFVLKLGNKYFKMKKINPDSVSFSPENETPMLISAKKVFAKSKPASCTSSSFAGTDRRDAKTSIYRQNVTSYETIDDLITDLPATDDEMRNHNPKITRAPDSERVSEEDRYVKVKTAYIYGIYRESDNDFHCIVGNGIDGGSKMKLFNIEISGLPAKSSSDFVDMNDVRNVIIQKFGDISCRDATYKPVEQLIPVSIEGSLFYDVDHLPGAVGFTSDGISYHPTTAWEIHPVAQLELN